MIGPIGPARIVFGSCSAPTWPWTGLKLLLPPQNLKQKVNPMINQPSLINCHRVSGTHWIFNPYVKFSNHAPAVRSIPVHVSLVHMSYTVNSGSVKKLDAKHHQNIVLHHFTCQTKPHIFHPCSIPPLLCRVSPGLSRGRRSDAAFGARRAGGADYHRGQRQPDAGLEAFPELGM